MTKNLELSPSTCITFVMVLLPPSFNSGTQSQKPIRLARSTQADPAFDIPINSTKRFIILLSPFRGGSTFLGKLFDENSQVQYLYEPLHNSLTKYNKVVGADARHTAYELALLYLQQILHSCDIYPGGVAYNERWRFCGDAEENIKRFGSEMCPENHLYREVMVDVCRYRETTVLKIIRLQRLKDLLLIRNIRSANLRIVHLIRHPMGVMRSRKGWGRFAYKKLTSYLPDGAYTSQEKVSLLAWEAHTYCSDILENMRTLEQEPWLKARYLRVTHQQLSMHPIGTAKTIYEHAGLQISSELLNFFKNTSQGIPDQAGEKRGFLITSRVSKDVISAWKKMDKLSFVQIKAIGAECNKLMQSMDFGYSFDSLELDSIMKTYHPKSS